MPNTGGGGEHLFVIWSRGGFTLGDASGPSAQGIKWGSNGRGLLSDLAYMFIMGRSDATALVMLSGDGIGWGIMQML